MTKKFQLSNKQIDSIIDLALAEDISYGDVTSEILIPAELKGKALIMAEAVGVLAGGEVACRVFGKIDPSLKVELLMRDGAALHSGDIIATVCGRVRSILKVERVVLNFQPRLSGIA